MRFYFTLKRVLLLVPMLIFIMGFSREDLKKKDPCSRSFIKLKGSKDSFGDTLLTKRVDLYSISKRSIEYHFLKEDTTLTMWFKSYHLPKALFPLNRYVQITLHFEDNSTYEVKFTNQPRSYFGPTNDRPTGHSPTYVRYSTNYISINKDLVKKLSNTAIAEVTFLCKVQDKILENNKSFVRPKVRLKQLKIASCFLSRI